MNIIRSIASIATLGFVFATSCEKKTEGVPVTSNATTATGRTDAARPAPAPDNTARNKGDGAAETKTPLDQSQSSVDIKVTAEIRRAIMDDKAMSMNAQNCKIITDKSGLVTLRGVVNSQAEKDSIEAKAKAVGGVTKVDNLLEIKTN